VEKGVVNRLERANILTLGPTREAGQVEWDKIWSRKLMQKAGMPTPRYVAFSVADDKSYSKATKIMQLSIPQEKMFLKTAGLAEGKGAIPVRKLSEIPEAFARLKRLKTDGGEGFLVENWVEGEEFSGYYLGYGGAFQELGFAQDHKRINNNEEGLNTGGMGAVSPTELISNHLRKRIRNQIINPLAENLIQANREYSGILYLGGMYNKLTDDLWIIEFNARWGDPEAQVIVPGISDFYNLSLSAAKKKVKNPTLFNNKPLLYDGKTRVSVAGTSLGYPDDYATVRGRRIEGLDKVIKRGEVKVYGAGVTVEDEAFYANGGRLFHLVGEGDNVEEARALVASEMSRIYIRGDKPGDNLLHFRTDIGLKEVQRKNV